MPSPLLKSIVESLEYDSFLPEEWRAGDLTRFSRDKTLYEYQQTAIKNAAKALYCYYGQTPHEWQKNELPARNAARKKYFLSLYQQGVFNGFNIAKYDRKKINPIFNIGERYFELSGENIPYFNLINRMGFWMATGSGKTLVIVKMLEHLRRLQKAGKIPGHDMLILAPTEHALSQIRRAVDEFNKVGDMQFELRDLRRFGRIGEVLKFNNTVPVYYCRANHLSEDKKEQMIDWRDYENGGRWFVFLDEAHKGGRDDSKRKAYYSLLARNGFLFNFSATFVDDDDIYTTAAQYNLSDFVGNGHGKRILLAGSGFGRRCSDFLPGNKNEITATKNYVVLESLMALSAARGCAQTLRAKTKRDDFYHMPLMLTLVNSVNTEEYKNDLLTFFEILKNIAGNTLDKKLFAQAKKSLMQDWRDGRRFFENNDNCAQDEHTCLNNMSVADLRQNIFGSERRGALEYMENKSKQIAFKLKTADAPFGLIKIGDISKWKNDFLRGMESVSVQNGNWFDNLDHAQSFSVLMGSRAFFESWDSTRPNIINFINIGTSRIARIFITQSIGRGVRISPLPGHRRRLKHLLSNLSPQDSKSLNSFTDKVAPLETLAIYATNQNAVNAVLDGMKEHEEKMPFMALGDIFVQNPKPKINNMPLPLLIPEYGDVPGGKPSPFIAAKTAINRLRNYVTAVPDSVLMVAYGMSASTISYMRAVANGDGAEYTDNNNGNYGVDTMRDMFVARAATIAQEANDNDIVHFLHMQASLSKYEIQELKSKIDMTVKIGDKEKRKKELIAQLANGKISEKYFDKEYEKLYSKYEEFIKDNTKLIMKYCAKHYYAPLITADGRADFIRFVIDVPSEREFVEELGKYLATTEPDWDSWMFCKLHEQRDKIYVPYQNNNRTANFYPDFIFWMKRGNDYQIVFVDPKGMEHIGYTHKADGYMRIFENCGKPRVFIHGKLKVSVRLLFYNTGNTQPAAEYKRFCTKTVAAIFNK